MPGLPEVNPVVADNFLAGLGPQFLDEVLAQNGIKMLNSRAEVIALLRDPKMHQEYMHKLYEAVHSGIYDVNNERYGQYIAFGAHVLKLCLSRDSFIDQNFYKDNINAIKGS